MGSQSVMNAQFTMPSAAASVAVTPNNTAWTNSAWFELLASTSTSIVLTGLIVTPDDANVTSHFEVDIGTGAGGSEVVVTTFRGSYGSQFYASPGYLPLTIPLDNIASSKRVSCRMRKSHSGTLTWTVAAVYYKKPLIGTLLTTAKPQKAAPAAASGELQRTRRGRFQTIPPSRSRAPRIARARLAHPQIRWYTRRFLPTAIRAHSSDG